MMRKPSRDIQSDRLFESVWWTVKLPLGWIADRDDKCASFRADHPVGVLQISAALKETSQVSDKDLKDFVSDSGFAGKDLRKVTYGMFSGFSREYSDGQLFWTEWWLKNNNLMIYATYNVRENIRSKAARDFTVVEGILTSLESRK